MFEFSTHRLWIDKQCYWNNSDQYQELKWVCADLHRRWKHLPRLNLSVVKPLTLLTSLCSRWSFLCWYHSFTAVTAVPSTHTHTHTHGMLRTTQCPWQTHEYVLYLYQSYEGCCMKFISDTHSPGLCMWSVVWPGRLTSGADQTSPALPFCSGSPSVLPASGSPGLNKNKQFVENLQQFESH